MKKQNIDCSKPLEEQVTITDLSEEEISIENSAISSQIISQAKIALAESDMVALRCVKIGVVFPLEWRDYVTTLRGIAAVGGSSIPDKPSYPEGT